MKMIVWFVFVLAANSAADKVVVARVGETFTLDCGILTYSKSLEWRHRGVLIIRIDGKTGRSFKGTSPILGRSTVRSTKLEIKGVSEEDSGEFKCQVDEKTYKQTLLLVSVSVDPSGVLQRGSKASLRCQVTGLEQDSLVQWKRPSAPSPTGSQEVHLSPVEASDGGVWQCVFSHGGEIFSENKTITVEEPPPQTTTSSFIKSSKDPPAPSGVTVRPSSEDVYLLGLSWWVWLAIGGGFLFLTLLMVFVILSCKTIRRRKRRFQRMKNPQLLKPKTFCQCHHPTAAAKPQQGRRREPPSALRL